MAFLWCKDYFCRVDAVRVGDYSMSDIDEFEEEIPIRRIIQHPDFSVWTAANDICLLELVHSADTSSQFVSSSDIPEQEAGVGTLCQAAGWEAGLAGEDYLQKVEV